MTVGPYGGWQWRGVAQFSAGMDSRKGGGIATSFVLERGSLRRGEDGKVFILYQSDVNSYPEGQRVMIVKMWKNIYRLHSRYNLQPSDENEVNERTEGIGADAGRHQEDDGEVEG